MKQQLRLDKFLANMGIGTRTEVKQYIRKGLVSINNETVKKADCKVNTETDTVCYNNQVVSYVNYEYYILNKPAGVISATEDKKDTTVIDLIKDKKRKDLFPVGRLDKDTEGLLIITNDGKLNHNLLSPKKHVKKVYYAKIDGCVTEEDRVKFKEGIILEDGYKCLPSDLKINVSDTLSEIELTLYEGKFHQVKRMFEAVDKKVMYLKRIQMGNLKIDKTLEIGQYRPLTEKELALLEDS
ncbi:16S rRNA pseudouridine516 synthase [Natranaerovirga hydrolytica]|uniref:Pseudouridine synthase n=1 Tax=Natranaerovirga hydrolytica TaxID=680378 RepID=A0A4R1MYI0_9FIRM|nr:pseudouridine synthase [Natranaerovirga hydrolytica]TCK98276.1 16S rRNA pseudouridine516 synthase [Natranaerovirga hydrolytica]